MRVRGERVRVCEKVRVRARARGWVRRTKRRAVSEVRRPRRGGAREKRSNVRPIALCITQL